MFLVDLVVIEDQIQAKTKLLDQEARKVENCLSTKVSIFCLSYPQRLV
jgi:hypothetical protein